MAYHNGPVVACGGGSVAEALCNAGRLARLRAADLMDTPPDEDFDRLSRLASKTVRTPVALVTLVAEDRQFFKSCLGLPDPWGMWRQTPLSHSFCQHVVATCRPLVIADAREDERVRENLAIRDLGVIAYLGIPLTTPDGNCLGSFCVIDRVPRQWSEDEIWVVQTLAHSVMSEIELRQHRAHLHAMVQERTAQLAAELERSRRLQEELHQALDVANKANEAKRRFIATLSHELRTPLAPVLLSAALGADTELPPEEAREMFGMIRDQVELEARLIDELLQAADLGRGRIIPAMMAVDVHALLKQVADASRSEASKRAIVVDLQFGVADATVQADSGRLGQAFSQVLSNSLKFSSPHSRITVRTRRMTGAQNQPAICIEFIDEGIGLASEEVSHIFEPFWQTPSGRIGRYGGIGLGLTITKTLVELHGGTLSASSEGPGRGTTLTICLPAA